MRKIWEDVNWLSTLKKHSQFESCEIWNLKKLKKILNNFFNFKNPLPHVNGCNVFDIQNKVVVYDTIK